MALPKKDGDHTNNPYGADLAKTKSKDGKYDFAAIEKKDSDGDGVVQHRRDHEGHEPRRQGLEVTLARRTCARDFRPGRFRFRTASAAAAAFASRLCRTL